MQKIKTENLNKTEKRIGDNVSKDAPLVSVIIPAYNCSEFIAETIDSVLSQKFTNYEIILVNDGSTDTDELEKILTSYFEKLIYIYQENSGAAAARNAAVQVARGEWLAFLDGDDVWLPDYLSEQLKMCDVKSCDLIYADALFFGQLPDKHRTFMQKSPSRGAVTTENLIGINCHIITSGTIVKRKKVLAVGLFDEKLPRIGMEDFDLWFRLAKAGDHLCYQKRILLKYRVRPDSLSGSNVQRAEREIIALETVRKKYVLTETESTVLEKRLRQATADIAIEKGKLYLTRREYGKAKENFQTANVYYRKIKYRVLLMLLAINPTLVFNLYKKTRPREFLFVAPKDGRNVQNASGETESAKPSLLQQSAWLMFAKTIGFVLSSLLPFLIVRLLTQDEVGVYRQAFQIVTNAVSILPLGFSMSAFYFLNREPEKHASVIFNILLFNFVTGGLACFGLYLYPQFLGNIFQSAELTRLAPVIGIVVWLWIFSTFLEIVALANQETKLATAFIILAQFTKTLLMVGAVVFFATVEAFLYAAIIQAFLQTGILLVYLNRRFPGFWTSFDAGFFRTQLFYALPFGLAALLYTIQTDIHNYFVGYRFSDADYAIYAYGCFELPLIAMLYDSFGAVMIPRMSELESKGKKREMLAMVVSAMRKLALVYFPLFIFLMIVAQEFITTLFTKNYAASVPIFRVNLLLLPIYILMLDPVARAFPHIGRFLLKIRVVLFLGLISALYFGIQHFDLRGMIAIVVVAVLLEKLISLAKISGVLEIKWRDVYLLKPVGMTALAALFSGATLYLFYFYSRDLLLTRCLNFSQSLLSLINFTKATDFFGGSLFLGICFLIFLSVYLLAANWFGIIDAEDKQKFRQLVVNRFPFIKKLFGQSSKKENQKSKTEDQLAITEHLL